jgi:hypothetical protein
MRYSWLVVLTLLAACSSSVPDSRTGPKGYFESVVRQVAGPGATDCGTTGPRFPSNAVRECATTNLTRRDPFFAIRYEQGVGSDTGTGWVLDGAGRLFLVSYDELDCRTVECAVTLAECGKLEILKEWEWFRASDCQGRTLPEVADPAAVATPPVNPR